ncbi:MAG: F0F1 ATP synthase subunit B [Candidatus Methylomirabilales bacterium]
MSVLDAVIAAEEGGGPDLNPFKPEFGLYVWVTIAFIVVFYMLAKKVFPRLDETLADRERRIKKSLEDAETTKREAEKLLDDYKARVAQVREEANRIADEIREQAKASAREMISRTEAESREILTKAQAELSAEHDRTVGQLRNELAGWAVEIAGRIVQRELSPEVHRDLVDAFIREVAQQQEASRS